MLDEMTFADAETKVALLTAATEAGASRRGGHDRTDAALQV